jgi:hypothetical protein
MVRDALVSLLTAHGLKPVEEEGWVHVRRLYDPWLLQGVYTVTVAHRAAKTALWAVLRRITRSSRKDAVGVWVLSESEARQLCADASIGSQHFYRRGSS